MKTLETQKRILSFAHRDGVCDPQSELVEMAERLGIGIPKAELISSLPQLAALKIAHHGGDRVETFLDELEAGEVATEDNQQKL